MSSILIRKSGNILELSHDGGELPRKVRTALEEVLFYDKIEHLYGQRRYTESIDGTPRRILTTRKHLYRYDKLRRFVCGFGFLPRIKSILADLQVPFTFSSVDPPRERPGCFQPHIEEVTSRFKFREKQEECLLAIAQNSCGLVHAVTGFGKMVMIAMTCLLYPKAKFIIVTKRRSLAHKIQTFLSKWLPNIGLVGDGSRNFGRITVYTLASLHHCPFDADFMLVDEAHEVLSDKYSKYLVSSLYTRNFAFTASPTGRSDGSDIRMESVFGPKIFHITYDEAVKLGLVVPIRVEWSDVRLMTNPCKNMEGARKKRYGLWQNDERNKIIAQKARTFGPDEQVQILVETIEHAVFLRQHLPEYTLIYANMKPEDRIAYIKHGLLPAGEPLMTSERMEENRKAFEAGELKKVITTNVWAVGIDPTQLTALIRADAGASEIMDVQAPGRVSRTHSSGGKNVGIVCDFFDQFDHATSQRAKKRVKHYRDMGWSQYAGPAGEVFTPESKLFRKV